LLLASTLLVTTSVLGLTQGWAGVHVWPRWWMDPLTLVLLSTGTACLFKYVPHTYVRWRDAWAGGVFVGLGLELAKKCLGYYLLKVPTYSLIYGAFAAVPILLIWIYVAWMVVLLGAELAANLPYWLRPQKLRLQAQAWQLELALELLQALHLARQAPQKGLTATELTQQFGLELGQLELVIGCLRELDWVATLDEADATVADHHHREPRWVLLVEPEQAPLSPLLQALLFKPEGALAPVWQLAAWGPSQITLAQALQR
jgi:membrane protein